MSQLTQSQKKNQPRAHSEFDLLMDIHNRYSKMNIKLRDKNLDLLCEKLGQVITLVQKREWENVPVKKNS